MRSNDHIHSAQRAALAFGALLGVALLAVGPAMLVPQAPKAADVAPACEPSPEARDKSSEGVRPSVKSGAACHIDMTAARLG